MRLRHFNVACTQLLANKLSIVLYIYIDDVLIYSSSWEEHLVHIRGVLFALREADLTAQPSKCVWGARSLESLNLQVGGSPICCFEKGCPSFHTVGQMPNKYIFVNVHCDEHTFPPPRSEDKLVLHTDASMLGVGALLSVEREGEEFPVAYLSKILTAAERKWSA